MGFLSLNLVLEGIFTVCFQFWITDGISDKLGQLSPILCNGMVSMATRKCLMC